MNNRNFKHLFLGSIIFMFVPFDGYLYILFGLSIILLIMTLRGIYKKKLHIDKIQLRYMSLLLIWFLWNLFSTVWINNRYAWLLSIGVIFISIVNGLALTYLYNDNFFRILLRYTILSVLIAHQFIAWTEWLIYLFRFGPGVTLYNPMWFFANINDFALLQLFTIFYVLFWREEWNPSFISKNLNVLLKTVLIGSSLLLILLATSRGIFAAAIFGLLVYGILSIKNQELQKKIWIGFLVIIVAISIFLIPTIINDPSIVIRNNLVLNGFEHLKMTNFLGVGAGNISYYLENFIFVTPTNGFTVMHNWFMGILVTNGLVFFLIYASYYLYAFMKSFKIAFTTQDYRSKFLASWLAAFFIASVIPNSLFHIMWFWFIHHFTFIEFEDLNNCDIESKV